MKLTKMVVNTATGEIENIPLTDEEIAAHEAAQVIDEASAE